jgi:Ca2+-binding RTX toxin-like protein
VQPGDVIDGGNGNRAVAAIDVGAGSLDFTGATISNVGGLIFDGNGTAATFTNAQIQSIGLIQDDQAAHGINQTLIVHDSLVDLSVVTFQFWDSTNKVLIEGTPGNDHLTGANGVSNRIDGGPGNDVLTGGSAGDTFVFDSHLNKHTNVDHITNFVHGADKVALSHQIFGAHLVINARSFYAAPQAHHALDADDRIIYDKSTGALYYEKSLAAPAVEFAVLSAHPHLTFHDFVMVA